MIRYETLLLTVPEITQDETAQLETQLRDLISKEKGVVVSFERWGKYRLAYPVKKNDYGVYFLMRFEVDKPESLLESMKALFRVKLHTLVMRHMVSYLDPHESLTYNRPLSLEETPSSESYISRSLAGSSVKTGSTEESTWEEEDQQDDRSEENVR